MKSHKPLLVLGILALAPACKRVEGAEPSRSQAQPQRPPAPVTVATAIERDVPVYLDQIGKNVAPGSVLTFQEWDDPLPLIGAAVDRSIARFRQRLPAAPPEASSAAGAGPQG